MMLSTQKKHLYWQRIRFVSSVLLFSIFVFQILANIAGAAALVKPINNLGLVGYWNFDSIQGTTAPDISGNGNHGTLSGGDSGGGEGFTVGHSRTAANTSTGNQAFTISWADGGSHTPEAAEIRVTPATADATAVDSANISTGATDGTNQWVKAFIHESGLATTNTEDYFSDSNIIAVIDPSGGSLSARASFVSFGTNTVTVNWSDAPPAGYLVHVVAYTGTEAVVAGRFDPSTTDGGTVDVTTLGQPAHYVYINGSTQNGDPNETITNHGGITNGFFTYDGSTGRNVHTSFGSRDNRSGGGETAVRWSNNYAGAELRNGGAVIDGTYVISTHASGFTSTSHTIGAFPLDGNPVAYLAMALPTGINAYAGVIDTKTTTGTESYTDAGFKPQAITIVGSFADSTAGPIDSDSGEGGEKVNSTPESDNFFVGTAISTSDQHAVTVTNHTGQSTTNTQSMSVSHIAQSVTDSGTTKIVADLSSFDATGFTLNFTTTDADVRNWVYVAFEEDGSSGGGGGSGSNPTSVAGQFGKALSFDGTSSYVDVGDIGTINTISFWINTSTTTEQAILNIDGTDKIEINAGEIVATSFPNATVYVDGSTSPAPLSSGWHHVVIADSTGVDASTFEIGRADPSYFSGLIDEVRVYNRVLAVSEIPMLLSPASTRVGSSPRVSSIGGLLGWWTFDGQGLSTTHALDMSGNGWDGSLGGNPTPTIGRVGQALSFDNTDDYIQLTDVDFITGGFTLSAWILTRATAVEFNNIISKEPNSGGSGRIYIFYSPSADQLEASINDGAFQGTDYVGGGLNDGEWHHVLMRVDATTLELFVDGVSRGTDTHDNSLTTNDNPWFIGARNTSANIWDGRIDDVRIYNRALTDREVELLFTSTKPSIVKSS